MPLNKWSWRQDSNPRPADYKSAALPTELRQHKYGALSGAGNGSRTRNLQLGRLSLYQLSYSRKHCQKPLVRYRLAFILSSNAFAKRPFQSNVPKTVLQGLCRPFRHSLKNENWWRGKDSNLRRLCQRIYSPSPLTAREPRHIYNAKEHTNDCLIIILFFRPYINLKLGFFCVL